VVPVLTGPIADYSYLNPAPSSFLNDVQFTNLSMYADTWTWYFQDDQSTSTELNPLHRFPEEGTYDVLLVTYNNNGCLDSIIYSVSVQEEISVFYPNSFTPNGDGMNENFQPIGASLEEYELTIWDRWGELIYEGNSKMSWNGLINNSGKPAPEGVYVFRIDLISDKFEEKVVTGRVTLIR
jgi:gliding motility-associated-like protein